MKFVFLTTQDIYSDSVLWFYKYNASFTIALRGDSKADVILGLLQWFCHVIVVTS